MKYTYKMSFFNISSCIKILLLIVFLSNSLIMLTSSKSFSNLKKFKLLKLNKTHEISNYISKHLHRLDNYYSRNALNCNYIKSLDIEIIKNIKSLGFYLREIYISLQKSVCKKCEIDEERFNKDKIIKDSGKIYAYFPYLTELLNNSKDYIFYLYTVENFHYVNLISKCKNFKQIVMPKDFKPGDLTNNKNNSLLLDKFIMVYKFVGAYIRYKSTDKIEESKSIFRGVSLFKTDFILNNNNSNESKIIFSPSPLSFSYSKNIALNFSKTKNKNKQSVIFEITKSENCFGKTLNSGDLSYNTNEEEFLLRSFTYMKIISNKFKDSKYIIKLECLKENNYYGNVHVMK